MTRTQQNHTPRHTQEKAAALSASALLIDESVKKVNSHHADQAGHLRSHLAKQNNRYQDKVALLGSVRQRLAEAQDTFRGSGEASEKAREVASVAAIDLYRARKSNMLNEEEVTSLLGDIFGYALKKDGTPSKTPAGPGAEIRKRVQRAVKGHLFLHNNEGDRFFDALDPKDVSPILKGMEQGKTSIWTVWDQLADLRRKLNNRTELALDPKRIAGLVAKLGEKGVADTIRKSAALTACYGELLRVLDIIDAGFSMEAVNNNAVEQAVEEAKEAAA